MGGPIRNLERTREALLAAGFQLIFRRGFQGVSVADIVQQAGLTKGAFFHHFENKQELGYAVVDETIRELMMNRWIHPMENSSHPTKAILTQLKKVIDETPEERLALGCPLNNLMQEMSSVDTVFHEKLQSVLLMWIDETERQLKRARQMGQLKPGVKPRQAAEFIVMAHEGFFGIIKGLGDKRIFRSLYESLKIYIEAISE